MKNLSFLMFLILSVSSCSTYTEIVSVQNRDNVPDGTKDIIVSGDLEIVKAAFTANGIMVKSMEGGFITEDMLLDEGTRAMYKVHDFDNQIRITSFWGITQKVKSEIILWAGAEAASAYDVEAFDQVIYDKSSSRSKKVFDYAIQIIESGNLSYTLR
jgi:hypothetical protein